jgi:hypothetical protein
VIIKRFRTLDDLWHGGCDALLYAPASKLSWAAGATTGIYDNVLICDSMEYGFDCADIWLTRGRFRKLQRDYLDYDLVPQFVEKAASMKPVLARRGTVTQMSCRVHGTVKHPGRKDNYKWGNCIFGFSFRPTDNRSVRGKAPKTSQAGVFTMHSRTSYISYMGGMDLALSYVLARAIAKERGDAIEDYGFRWMVDSLQWYSIKSLAYLSTFGELEKIDSRKHRKKWPDNEYPSCKITRNSYDFMKRRLDAEEPPKYGPTLRIWSMLYGIDAKRPAPSPVDSLTLEALSGAR